MKLILILGLLSVGAFAQSNYSIAGYVDDTKKDLVLDNLIKENRCENGDEHVKLPAPILYTPSWKDKKLEKAYAVTTEGDIAVVRYANSKYVVDIYACSRGKLIEENIAPQITSIVDLDHGICGVKSFVANAIIKTKDALFGLAFFPSHFLGKNLCDYEQVEKISNDDRYSIKELGEGDYKLEVDPREYEYGAPKTIDLE